MFANKAWKSNLRVKEISEPFRKNCFCCFFLNKRKSKINGEKDKIINKKNQNISKEITECTKFVFNKFTKKRTILTTKRVRRASDLHAHLWRG